ncbi:hypothetical protein BV22DRAFT_137407 [Leucogyrophana mollusca]|uniref:Uncharacterized protein n=1 Tax=Leucogyrophana mollusca TaxID=85980 RepID=A0ACB8BVS3_9AGAM|nr:hypothetical protein BV22DRAFT_137407 [Leucogyrophana mollusca]
MHATDETSESLPLEIISLRPTWSGLCSCTAGGPTLQSFYGRKMSTALLWNTTIKYRSLAFMIITILSLRP